MAIAIPTERLKTVIDKGKVKQRSVFINKQPDLRELASEIIRSDCMNKGYRVVKNLGSGAYAKVKLAEVSVSKLARHVSMADHLDTGKLQVAIKIIHKKLVPQEFLKKFLPRELDNHTVLPPHPHVVRCFEQFSTSDFTYMVMEYVCNGDLLDMINHSISNIQRGLGEDISKKFLRQIALGLRHIHQNGIVHRDIKCENILIDGNLDIKITDFGFSCRYNDKSVLLKTSCGSYAYTAPEVIKNQPYDGTHADIWSLGIILCAMVNGRLPYNDGHLSEMEEDMRMQRLRFERNVPFDCMVLVRKLLQYNPTIRPAIDEILSDPWLTGKKPIPRQTLKPKWSNSYSVSNDDGIVKENTLRLEVSKQNKTSPICYRAISPEKTKGISNETEAVVLNSAARETIILKSRRPGNAYRSAAAPRNERRPKTWPKAVREQAEKIRIQLRSVSEDKHDNRRIRQLMNVTKERARATLVKKVNNHGAAKPSEYTPFTYMYKFLQPDGQIQCRSPSPPISQKHKAKLVTTHTAPASTTPPPYSSPTQFTSIKVPERLHQKATKSATVDKYCRQMKKRAASAKPTDSEGADAPDLDMIEVDMVRVKGKVSPASRIKSVPASGGRRRGGSPERQTPAERAKSCRERIMHAYCRKETGTSVQKSPIPSLVVQTLGKDDCCEVGLSCQVPYRIHDRSRSTSPDKHSIKTIYKYRYH